MITVIYAEDDFEPITVVELHPAWFGHEEAAFARGFLRCLSEFGL